MISGMRFPLRIHGGRISVSTDEEHVKQSVQQILGTELGEYPLVPEFGAGLGKRVFDPVNTIHLAKYDIKHAIETFETRVKFLDIQLDESKAHEGRIVVTVSYLIKSTEQESSTQITIRG